MTWQERARLSYRRLFHYSGRATRVEYAVTILGSVSIWLLSVGSLNVVSSDADALGVLVAPAIIGMLMANHSAAVRRLHDIGKGHSGWWTLFPYVALFLFFARSGPDNRYGPRHMRDNRPSRPVNIASEQVLQYTHQGERFLLGYTPSSFVIWDRSLPTAPVAVHPRNDEGWAAAWLDFVRREPSYVQDTRLDGSAAGEPGPRPPEAPG